MNFLECTLLSANETTAAVRLGEGTSVEVAADARGVTVGSPLTLGIRPEHIQADRAASAGTVPGLIQVAEHLGDTTFLYIDTLGSKDALTVKSNPENTLNSGDEAHLRFPADRCFLFDAEGKTLAQTHGS